MVNQKQHKQGITIFIINKFSYEKKKKNENSIIITL